MALEIKEVSGRIKFGVRRNHSFVSFLEEPQTRFKVTVDVGDQYLKLKDIPIVSEYIEGKMRDIIRRKFVYPMAHRTRLMWPRNWWPSGTEHDFLPTQASPEHNVNNRTSPIIPESTGVDVENGRETFSGEEEAVGSAIPLERSEDKLDDDESFVNVRRSEADIGEGQESIKYVAPVLDSRPQVPLLVTTERAATSNSMHSPSEKTASAWISNLAQKTKSKFDKHFRSGDEGTNESSANSSSIS